jgi:hypothetical protein
VPSTLPFKTAIGIGVESTRGTAVSRTNWLEVQSAEFTETATYERFPVLQAVWGGSRQVSHISAKQVTGTIVVPLQYTGVGILLKGLLGAVATTGGSAPYTHTYTLGTVPPEYLTIEKIIGTSGQRELLTGCAIAGGRIRFRRSAVAFLELDIIGYKSDGFGAAATPSFGASVVTRAVYSRHLDNSASGIPFEFTWNSANYTAQEVTVSFDNAVSDVGDMGSYYATDVDQGNERLVTVQVGLRHVGTATDALYTAHLSEISSDLTFSATGDSANQDYAFTCRNAKLTDMPAPPLSGSGRVIVRPTWTLHDDAVDAAITIAVQNASSSHDAN